MSGPACALGGGLSIVASFFLWVGFNGGAGFACGALTAGICSSLFIGGFFFGRWETLTKGSAR